MDTFSLSREIVRAKTTGEQKTPPEMEITKNKNQYASLKILYRFLNPYPRLWIFYWKSQRFGKSLETFGSLIFHRLVWIFLWIFNCFEFLTSMFCFK